MTQLSKVKQNINQHKDKSCNLIKLKKTNSRPNRAVWTVSVNCAYWRGSTLAIYKTVLIIFPLNLQTISRLYMQKSCNLMLCTSGQKMVCNAIHKAFLNTKNGNGVPLEKIPATEDRQWLLHNHNATRLYYARRMTLHWQTRRVDGVSGKWSPQVRSVNNSTNQSISSTDNYSPCLLAWQLTQPPPINMHCS